MAKEEVRRLQPEIISEDQDCHAAVKALSDYKPSDSAYAKTALQTASDDLDDAHEKETQAEAAWKAARDRAVKAEWTFHNLILGTKTQVKAQYGADSDEIKSVGLKKKSEYKRPVRQPKTIGLPKAA
jgi:cellobiose-specific phosphotransferase system component IIA